MLGLLMLLRFFTANKRMEKGWSRVTSVLSALNSSWLEFWWRKNGFEACDKIRDDSTAFGKKVHSYIEDYVRDGKVPPAGREGTCALAVIKWLSDNKVKPLHLEVELKDSKLRLVGHADLLCEIDGEQIVLDYKTSKKVSKDYALQLSAYAHMANKQLGTKIDKGIILRADKDPEKEVQLEVVEYTDMKKYWKIFLAGLQYYKFIQGK